MTPLSIHLAALGMAILVLFCLGTQVSARRFRGDILDWRTLLVICAGQWLLLPIVLFLFLRMTGGDDREVLAIAIISLSPAGVFACTALFLIGIPFTAALASILLLEVMGAIVLHAMVNLMLVTDMFGPGVLEQSLRDVSRSQLLLLFVPLLLGAGVRYMAPGIGEALARPTKLLIWLGYIAVAGYAISLKIHFSYRVDVIANLPIAIGIIGCGIAAGFAVYLLSHYVVRLRGQDAVMASTLIGLQGPGPAILLTLIHGNTWTELAAITINYALLLPLLALFWLIVSRSRWGAALLPRQ